LVQWRKGDEWGEGKEEEGRNFNYLCVWLKREKDKR
jgi:hypothetical protein